MRSGSLPKVCPELRDLLATLDPGLGFGGGDGGIAEGRSPAADLHQEVAGLLESAVERDILAGILIGQGMSAGRNGLTEAGGLLGERPDALTIE